MMVGQELFIVLLLTLPSFCQEISVDLHAGGNSIRADGCPPPSTSSQIGGCTGNAGTRPEQCYIEKNNGDSCSASDSSLEQSCSLCLDEDGDTQQVEHKQLEGENAKFASPSELFHRSMEGLGDVLDQVKQSRAKVIEKLGGVMDQVAHSKDLVMASLDKVMDRVSESMSESKVKAIKSLDSVLDKVSESKTKMMKGIDNVMDQVALSKVIEELDHVIDQVTHSKVIEEIRALPEEIRQSFVLNVRNRSYVAAGVMVAISTAILIFGALYFAWCHRDAWAYYRQPLVESDGHSIPPSSSPPSRENGYSAVASKDKVINGMGSEKQNGSIRNRKLSKHSTRGSTHKPHRVENSENSLSDATACNGLSNLSEDLETSHVRNGLNSGFSD